jgi:hypothetical protein
MMGRFKEIHDFSSRHREEVEKSALAGCFSCLIMFTPSDIDEWVDGDTTALCPHCSVDAVLPDNMGIELTHDLLRGMHDIWFKEVEKVEITQEIHTAIYKHIDTNVTGTYNKGILHMYLMVLDFIHLKKNTPTLEGLTTLFEELRIPLPDVLKKE